MKANLMDGAIDPLLTFISRFMKPRFHRSFFFACFRTSDNHHTLLLPYVHPILPLIKENPHPLIPSVLIPLKY